MQIEPRIPSTAIPPESSTYESVARSNQCGSSEQIIHTETRCVTETMVRLEHKSPQPDFQSDLQLTVPTVKPVEPNAHAIDSHRAYTHKTHASHVDRDTVNVENVRSHERREHMAAQSNGTSNEVGTKRLVQKDVYVAPAPINDGYRVYQSANVLPLTNGRLTSPEKSHQRAFVPDAISYELKAPALVSSIALQSLANGHLPNGKCDRAAAAAARNIIETESMDAWSMHKLESAKIDVADAAPNAPQFTTHTHPIKPIYHNRFNHTESKHYNNIIPKLDSRHDATPMQTHKKVRIHTIASYNCLLLVH